MIWFFFIRERDGSSTTTTSCRNEDCISKLYICKRKKNDDEHSTSLPQPTTQNDTPSVSRQFPIQYMPTNENEDEDDDPSIIYNQVVDDPQKHIRADYHSNLSNIVSEEEQGSSQHSRLSNDEEETILKESLMEHGQDQQ